MRRSILTCKFLRSGIIDIRTTNLDRTTTISVYSISELGVSESVLCAYVCTCNSAGNYSGVIYQPIRFLSPKEMIIYRFKVSNLLHINTKENVSAFIIRQFKFP